jgi:hypothetical protein
MGDVRNAYRVLFGKSEGKGLLGCLSVEGRLILKLILEKLCLRMIYLAQDWM